MVLGPVGRAIAEWMRLNRIDAGRRECSLLDGAETPGDVFERAMQARRSRNTGPPVKPPVQASRCARYDSRAAGSARMRRGQVPYTRR